MARASVEDVPLKPTIRSVAELADVAISTVSRVVNGGRASELIRRRVQRAIEELGYTPSIAAQSLVLRRTGCIGLAVNRSTSPWFSQILSGVEQALAPSRKSVLLGSMMLKGHYDPAAVFAWIAEGRVDGLIMVRYSRRDRPLIEAAQRARLPLVLIAPDVSAPADFIVRCNNFEAGAMVAAHLAKLGHRRIAFAGGPKDSYDTRQRLEGLREGLGEHQITMDPDLIWFGPSYSREVGGEYAALFLKRPAAERPTAVVLGNDAMALGFMRKVLQQGVRVPADVSVVGFDGTPDGEQFWPGLTSVLQPTQQMAISACEALLDRIDRRNQERASSVEFAVQMLERDSTAAPRA